MGLSDYLVCPECGETADDGHLPTCSRFEAPKPLTEEQKRAAEERVRRVRKYDERYRARRQELYAQFTAAGELSRLAKKRAHDQTITEIGRLPM